jgi:hypothetical protein
MLHTAARLARVWYDGGGKRTKVSRLRLLDDPSATIGDLFAFIFFTC